MVLESATRVRSCLVIHACRVWGNNPDPCIDMSDTRNHHLRCCDECNQNKVRPARMGVILRTGKRFVSVLVWTEEQRRSYAESLFLRK